MMKYSVSVIIPMYNAESTIEQVIDSVLEQTAVERVKEIIIVNDGSRDCSEQKVLDKIKEVKNIPIIYRYQENRGVSSARNEGMRIARGELIALLDSDDLWHADKLERQLEIFDHYPEVCFLGTGYTDKPFRRKGRTITTLYKADLWDIFWSFFPGRPSVMFKREAIEKVGYFDENQKYCEDINYYIRFAVHFNYYYLPDKLVDIDIGKKYRGEKGLTSNLRGMHEGEMKNLKEMYEKRYVNVGFYLLFYIFMNMKYFRRRIKHTITQYMKK